MMRVRQNLRPLLCYQHTYIYVIINKLPSNNYFDFKSILKISAISQTNEFGSLNNDIIVSWLDPCLVYCSLARTHARTRERDFPLQHASHAPTDVWAAAVIVLVIIVLVIQLFK